MQCLLYYTFFNAVYPYKAYFYTAITTDRALLFMPSSDHASKHS